MEDKVKELTLIEKADKAAQRIEKANEVLAGLLKQQEAIESRKILGGQSEAGAKPVEKTKEETDSEGMKNYFKGTALEGMFK